MIHKSCKGYDKKVCGVCGVCVMSAEPNEAIKRLLRAKEEHQADDGSGDVVFAVFLEPHKPALGHAPPGPFDRLLSFVVTQFQPSPVMVHVELVVPCAVGSAQPVSFATYIGSKSGWQKDQRRNAEYYLGTTANKWRAVPVLGNHVARAVRSACDECNNVDYCLFRYISAVWGVRQVASLIPDDTRAPAHCATLTARVLRMGTTGILKHASPWYGPSTLYAELCGELKERAVAPESTTMGGDVSMQVEKLLRQRDEDVVAMQHYEYLNAIRALTLKTLDVDAIKDPEMAVMAQKNLANALFRWSVLRTKGAQNLADRI